MPTLPTKIAWSQKISQTYRRLFSIQEIEADRTLQWCLGIFLGLLFFNFKTWSGSLSTSVTAVDEKSYMCWQFFQNCSHWFFLKLPPEGVSQLVFFDIFFTIIGAGIFFLYRRNFLLAHFCTLISYLARFYLLLISATYGANYWLYITYFGFIFLLLPHKKFFAQLLVVMCYYLSTTGKISDGWTLGTYFTSMQGGLPLAPYGSEIFLTNLVLFMEMAGCWLLFSSNKIIQRSTLAFFIAFHIYSVLIVGQTFPSIILPWVVLLFGIGYKAYQQPPLDKKSYPGWVFITAILFIQLIPNMIPGDDRQTQEVGSFALRMISSNNQCRSFVIDGKKTIDTRIGPGPEVADVCALYGNFSRLQARYCPSKSPLRFIYDHSINGHPYYRIIDAPDLCALTYKPFTHNTWIGDESNSRALDIPRISGPMTDYSIRSTTMRRSFRNNNEPTTLSSVQTALIPHLHLIHSMWWALWWGLLAYLFSRFLVLSKPNSKPTS